MLGDLILVLISDLKEKTSLQICGVHNFEDADRMTEKLRELKTLDPTFFLCGLTTNHLGSVTWIILLQWGKAIPSLKLKSTLYFFMPQATNFYLVYAVYH